MALMNFFLLQVIKNMAEKCQDERRREGCGDDYVKLCEVGRGQLNSQVHAQMSGFGNLSIDFAWNSALGETKKKMEIR